MIRVVFEIHERAPNKVGIANIVLDHGGTPIETELARLVCISASTALQKRTPGKFAFEASGPHGEVISEAIRKGTGA